MFLVWVGVILLVVKAVGWGPFEQLSWVWVLLPFGLAIAWFEWGERLFGRDRRKAEHIEWEKRRQDRVKAQWQKARRK